MQSNKKIYFASDFHLGVPTLEKSLEREKLVVKWLDTIKHDAQEIYLVGDVFDFWFEHKHTVPKGFVRLLGKLAELSDSGIIIHLFAGNHDLWLQDYFPKELGIKIYKEPIIKTYHDKIFFIGHGDGLGPGDNKYKLLKKLFTSRTCHWLYSRIHPNLSFSIAHYFSRKSRFTTGDTDDKFLGEENEWLVLFCKEELKRHPINYFIFGHRHLPLDIKITETCQYINLGDWVKYFTYAEFDGEKTTLKTFN